MCVCVARFGGARMRRKSKLSDAAGDCSVGDFAGEVFVAGASGFGSGSGKDVLFLWGKLCANELGCDLVEGVL